MSTYNYRPRDYPRVADCCGVTWNVSKLVKKEDGLFYCPDHRGFIPPITLSKANARAPVIKILPRKDPKVRENIGIYQDEEAKLRWLLVDVAPFQYWDATNGDGAIVTAAGAGRGILAAAESIRAHYDILAEDKRPLLWMIQADTEIIRLADWLLQWQFGSPTATGDYVVASTATPYGAFAYDNGSTDFSSLAIRIYSEEVAAGGLAMVYAYNRNPTAPKYLTAARNAATCMRRMQCGDKLTTDYTTTLDQGTIRYHTGIWTHSFTYGNTCTTPTVTSETTTVNGSSFDPVTIVFSAPVKVTAFTVTYPFGSVPGAVVPALGGTSATWTFTPSPGFWPNSGPDTATVTADAGLCSAQTPTWSITVIPAG